MSLKLTVTYVPATKTAAAPGARVTSNNAATGVATEYTSHGSTANLPGATSTTSVTGPGDGPSSRTIAIIASVCTVVGTAAAVATAWYARKGLKEKFKSVGRGAQRAFAFNNV
ncbi:hypothetical protein P167DRAFT_24508 [Morchella conica CCBAS932]|uniref:Uncharacterized protein n=1 Tax=Morchella conica CCBAS932 TaxID=1392247 RepID=A0A3N4KBR3_9PEZI|nr:hypothetical protein P167DRAFT_24508 [Morchella conica CCBAS932]